ncbi:MAG: Tat pathway signal protein [Saprospiraceae bacterium]|nr:Tat pathway signal protein [Saprospiraceae bacterium]
MRNKELLILTIIFIIAVSSFSCKSQEKQYYKSFGKIDYKLNTDDEKMLDSIQYKTFLFFLNEHHPDKGIVKDRSAQWAPASIAATGFGLPGFAIAVERKWITREKAAEITLNTLRFFADSPQNKDINGVGYRGFYYHFLKMDTGTREWNCELSSIDSGILFMGIIFARNYYNKNTDEEKEIRTLSDKLLSRLEWDLFYMPDNSKHPNTISMAWKPEEGQLNWGWHGYNEALFLYILAAGTNMANVEKSYEGWLRTYEWKTPYKGLSHVIFPPLFGHQFSHAFIDFRGLTDPYMKEKGIDYFENSRRATLTQQQYAIENPKGWVGYDSYTWGFTASDGPGSTYNFEDKKFEGYTGRGASGKDHTVAEDGTIAPYAVLSSLPFTPELSIATIKNMNSRYGKKLWGKYGFYDSFNPTADWVNNDFIGIDQGPMLLMIENFRTGLIWEYVMKDPIIQKGLKKLNFEYLK